MLRCIMILLICITGFNNCLSLQTITESSDPHPQRISNYNLPPYINEIFIQYTFGVTMVKLLYFLNIVEFPTNPLKYS